MDPSLVMGILQRYCNMLNISNNGVQWQASPFGVALAQCSIGRIVHSQKGSIIRAYTKVQQTHNIGVLQAKGRATSLMNSLRSSGVSRACNTLMAARVL